NRLAGRCVWKQLDAAGILYVEDKVRSDDRAKAETNGRTLSVQEVSTKTVIFEAGRGCQFHQGWDDVNVSARHGCRRHNTGEHCLSIQDTGDCGALQKR